MLGYRVVPTAGCQGNIPPPTQPDTPQPQPQPIPPPPAPQPQPSPIDAIVQISAPGVGCSATVIGPRRPDGRYWVLSAAHCVRAGGNKWRMRTRTGIVTSFTVVARDDNADWSWGITDSPTVTLPYALMAQRRPVAGTSIFVAGYGIGFDGSKRMGTYPGTGDSQQQLRFQVAVNHGDSGGGIINADTGECISPVCCTSGLGRTASVYGAAPELSLAGRPTTVSMWEWHPIDLPRKELGLIPQKPQKDSQ